jgi:hypothetical protein
MAHIASNNLLLHLSFQLVGIGCTFHDMLLFCIFSNFALRIQ